LKQQQLPHCQQERNQLGAAGTVYWALLLLLLLLLRACCLVVLEN
jgi:hypothetical protein